MLVDPEGIGVTAVWDIDRGEGIRSGVGHGENTEEAQGQQGKNTTGMHWQALL
jgi:hypothetical protein